MITVVIPAFNEGDSIGETVAHVRSVCNYLGLVSADILVVDDGSTDRTLEAALEAGALVVRHAHNLGYGRSLKTGIVRARHDAIVIVDADLTYPFESLPLLLEQYRNGFDMVVGARTGDYYRESVLKENLRTVLKWLVEFTAGRRIPDINSGFRIFSRSAVVKHIDHLCDTFSFTTSLTLAYMMTGRCVGYVPIDYHRRSGSTKVKLFRDSLRTLQYIVQAILFYHPIKLFVLISWSCLPVALSFCAAGLVSGSVVSTAIGCTFLLLSILVFCLGLLADLLRQVGLQLRPSERRESFEVFSAVPPEATSASAGGSPVEDQIGAGIIPASVSHEAPVR